MLNPKQRFAVSFGDGAALILAGPGAGKTTVLTRRILALVTDHGVPSEQILVITFTKAAAEEMKSRHLSLCGGRSRATFGTFHSFFFTLLKEELQLTGDDILDAKTRLFLLQKTAEELGIAADRLPDFFANIEREISFVKNADIQPRESGCKKDGDPITAYPGGAPEEARAPAGEDAACRAPAGEDAACRASAGEDAACRAPAGEGAACRAPAGEGAACRAPAGEAFAPRDLSPQAFAAFFARYEKAKDIYGKIDFDDMLLKARQLLTTDALVLEKWRRRYRYFLVDEAQDMNSVQYELIRLLAAPENNVCFVGDDDQSVYGFRAADAGWMRSFAGTFPGSTQIILDTNFRSAPAIVAASKRLIRHNHLRIDKDYAAARVCAGSITVHSCDTPEEEADFAAEAIFAEKKADPQKSIAVLFRNHAQSEGVITAFKSRALAFRYQKKEEDPYHYFLYRDVCAYFALAAGERQRTKLLRVMNRPNRFLPRAGLEEETVSFREWAAYHERSPLVVRAIGELEAQLNRMSGMSSFAAWTYLRRGMGYESFAARKAAESGAAAEGGCKGAAILPTPLSQEYEDAVRTIDALARRFPDKRDFLRALQEKREACKKAEECRRKEPSSDGAAPVRLLSFHGSKGLEFDHVYIIDACEGITPSKRAKSQKALEEERRMFYVAATRARDELTIITVARRGKERLYPSRFIREMAQ